MSPKPAPKLISARYGKFMLNCFPPLLFQRIRIEEFSDDFRYCRIRVKKSFLSRNLHGATFGGTIFSGADPAFGIMYWQVFAQKGERVQAWIKSARVRFQKPARSALLYEYKITDEDVAVMEAGLAERGTAVREHLLEARDEEGDVCASIHIETYLRRLPDGEKEASGF